MRKKILKTFFFLLAFSGFFGSFFTPKIFGQEDFSLAKEEVLEGKIIKILKEEILSQAGAESLHQELAILVTKGSLEGKEIEVDTGMISIVGQPKYKAGDQVLINYSFDSRGERIFFITDFVRKEALAGLFFIFLFLVVIINKRQGVSSLFGLGISFLVIFKFILPNLYAGYDPILIAVIGSLIIIPLTFYLSHGLNRKTTVAVAGTLIALIITGVLAKYFVNLTKLTGYASEEAGFLQVAKEGLNMRGLLLAGIIIGVLGVLDDITISQSAIVFQLIQANPKFKFNQLYQQAMKVGQDHISSMVNTLILVYTGAALPLLLLFIDNPRPFFEVLNYEIIADEVVRTLVGSIGLILAVPVTTIIAAFVAEKNERTKSF